MERQITEAVDAFSSSTNRDGLISAMREIVAAGICGAYRVSAGRDLTDADTATLDQMIADQSEYLDGFAADLAEYQPEAQKGVFGSLAGILHRALAYVVAAVTGAAHGRIADMEDAETVMWVTAGDNHVCPTCTSMAGPHTVSDLNANGIFPGGPGLDCGPSCRCFLQ